MSTKIWTKTKGMSNTHLGIVGYVMLMRPKNWRSKQLSVAAAAYRGDMVLDMGTLMATRRSRCEYVSTLPETFFARYQSNFLNETFRLFFAYERSLFLL